jgi:hypothetical protein
MMQLFYIEKGSLGCLFLLAVIITAWQRTLRNVS